MRAILVINSGSSTVKFSVFAINSHGVELQYKGIVDKIVTQPDIKIQTDQGETVLAEEISVSGDKEAHYQQAIEYILNWTNAKNYDIVAAGHRIVHGGPKYFKPIILTDQIAAELLDLSHIMPLHQPYNIKGVKVLQQELPDIIQVACFDTAFHATCNPISQHFALPKRFTDKGFRRYGFHGLSYEYVASQLPKYMGDKAQGKFVVAHLGNGSTMCAIENQKSVATSIGFTGLGGLPMATRCDSIDPGAVLYLLDTYGFTTEELRRIFYKESGFLGVSGFSSDMRDLLASDKPEAKLAVDIFVNRIVAYTGMLAAELEGIDGFIFTAGIGENASPVREQVCEHLKWLGMELDLTKNQQRVSQPTEISSKDSKIPVWVIPTNEELMIAEHTLELLENS